jgi:hypothetical protein
MASNRRPMNGRLLKAIHIDDAPARGLRAALALSDKSDVLAYVRNEFRARWVEFDRFFGLKGNGSGVDIGSSVQKHLLHMNSMLTPETRDCGSALPPGWLSVMCPVFFFEAIWPDETGAPREWNNAQLRQLGACLSLRMRPTARFRTWTRYSIEHRLELDDARAFEAAIVHYEPSISCSTPPSRNEMTFSNSSSVTDRA